MEEASYQPLYTKGLPMSVRRALSAAVVAGGAALAVAMPAAMAQASTGEFVYHNLDGRQALVDQPNDQCTEIWADSLPVHNRTDSIAVLYRLPNCSGPVQIVYPGEFTGLRLSFADSIMFINS